MPHRVKEGQALTVFRLLQALCKCSCWVLVAVLSSMSGTVDKTEGSCALLPQCVFTFVLHVVVRCHQCRLIVMTSARVCRLAHGEVCGRPARAEPAGTNRFVVAVAYWH